MRYFGQAYETNFVYTGWNEHATRKPFSVSARVLRCEGRTAENCELSRNSWLDFIFVISNIDPVCCRQICRETRKLFDFIFDSTREFTIEQVKERFITWQFNAKNAGEILEIIRGSIAESREYLRTRRFTFRFNIPVISRDRTKRFTYVWICVNKKTSIRVKYKSGKKYLKSDVLIKTAWSVGLKKKSGVEKVERTTGESFGRRVSENQ